MNLESSTITQVAYLASRLDFEDMDPDKDFDRLGDVVFALEEVISFFVQERGQEALAVVYHLVAASHEILKAGAAIMGAPEDSPEFDFDIPEIVVELYRRSRLEKVEVRSFSSNMDLLDFLIDTWKRVKLRLTDQNGIEKWVTIVREHDLVFRIEWEDEISGRPQVESVPVQYLLGLLWFDGKPDLSHCEVWQRREGRPNVIFLREDPINDN